MSNYIPEHPNYQQWLTNSREKGWVFGGQHWLDEMNADGDETFAVYLILCNKHMIRRVGLGINDVEDYVWRDSFDADIKPADAVQAALDYMGADL